MTVELFLALLRVFETKILETNKNTLLNFPQHFSIPNFESLSEDLLSHFDNANRFQVLTFFKSFFLFKKIISNFFYFQINVEILR